MHAFSMLSTNHGKMFQSLAPQAGGVDCQLDTCNCPVQVLATLGMAWRPNYTICLIALKPYTKADDQSAAMLFCSLARNVNANAGSLEAHQLSCRINLRCLCQVWSGARAGIIRFSTCTEDSKFHGKPSAITGTAASAPSALLARIV